MKKKGYKRSIHRRTSDNAKLKANPKRQAKRKALVGAKAVGQQNRAMYMSKTHKDATITTINRVATYKRAAKKKK